MKFRFLILLLIYSGTANSDDAEELDVGSQSPKKGDEIWLEEKISPTTTWIEDLVKPLTIWMEQKINAPEAIGESQEVSQQVEQGNTTKIPKSTSNTATQTDPLISGDQAGRVASTHIDGDVLYIKLVAKNSQYRVKLISKLGEIHIVYVDAISGDIILPDDQMRNESIIQSEAEQSIQTSPDSGSDTKDEERP